MYANIFNLHNISNPYKLINISTDKIKEEIIFMKTKLKTLNNLNGLNNVSLN